MSQVPAEKITTLLELAHDLGREDRRLVSLAEGNISCRIDDETFLVKASGASMFSLRDNELVACRFGTLLPLLNAATVTDAQVEKALLESRVNPAQPKPSVEAFFHAYFLSLPGIEVVGHTHPTVMGSILCAGEKFSRRFALERRFPDEVVCCGARSILVPYEDPGVILAQAIKRETDKFISTENRPPRLVLLQNHGLIAFGASCGSVLAATLMAEKAARIFVGATALGGPTALTPQTVARIDSRPDEHYRQRKLKL